jgi:hypothetical protein
MMDMQSNKIEMEKGRSEKAPINNFRSRSRPLSSEAIAWIYKAQKSEINEYEPATS